MSSSSNVQNQVDRARQEVVNLRNMVRQYSQSETNGESANHANSVRNMMKRVQHAEQILVKTEATIRRVKATGRSATRTAVAPRDGDRAKRALAVLLAAPHADPPDSDAGSVARRHLSAMPELGERVPLKGDQLEALYSRAQQASKLSIRSVRGGVGFLCENVFQAYMWYRTGDSAPSTLGAPSGKPIQPEWIAVFGIDEVSPWRWSASKHAVFGVLTERANAAVRYFWARERSGADAFIALARWLALHRTMFSDTCEGRRLAFDASRGIFLPPCVRSFDGTGGPRFTRGSIPVRSNYTRGANGANAQAPKPSGSGAHGNGTTAKIDAT